MQFDVSAMFLHDALNDGESLASAFPNGFRGEERIEHTALYRFRDAAAIVCDSQLDVIDVVRSRDCNEAFLATAGLVGLLDRVGRVHDQIQDELLQVPGDCRDLG